MNRDELFRQIDVERLLKFDHVENRELLHWMTLFGQIVELFYVEGHVGVDQLYRTWLGDKITNRKLHGTLDNGNLAGIIVEMSQFIAFLISSTGKIQIFPLPE